MLTYRIEILSVVRTKFKMNKTDDSVCCRYKEYTARILLVKI